MIVDRFASPCRRDRLWLGRAGVRTEKRERSDRTTRKDPDSKAPKPIDAAGVAINTAQWSSHSVESTRSSNCGVTSFGCLLTASDTWRPSSVAAESVR